MSLSESLRNTEVLVSLSTSCCWRVFHLRLAVASLSELQLRLFSIVLSYHKDKMGFYRLAALMNERSHAE